MFEQTFKNIDDILHKDAGVLQEADDPDALVDFLDADALTRQDMRDAAAFAVHAAAAAGGDQHVPIMQRVGKFRSRRLE